MLDLPTILYSLIIEFKFIIGTITLVNKPKTTSKGRTQGLCETNKAFKKLLWDKLKTDRTKEKI